jgi:hypothetical protein
MAMANCEESLGSFLGPSFRAIPDQKPTGGAKPARISASQIAKLLN